MKEILILLAIISALIAAIGYRDNVFAENCRAQGGTPDTSGYNRVCYAPGVAIDVN